jgi:hypothetical protein
MLHRDQTAFGRFRVAGVSRRAESFRVLSEEGAATGYAEFSTTVSVPLAAGMVILLGPDLVPWVFTSVETEEPEPESGGWPFHRCYLQCTLDGAEYLLPSNDATRAELPDYPGVLTEGGGWDEVINVSSTEIAEGVVYVVDDDGDRLVYDVES